MINFDDFIKKWEGKPCEVAGSSNALFQCVDLANAYIRDVLNLPIIEWTDAKDFPTKIGNNYDYIKNTLEGVPLKGDIVVWNGNVGQGHGHIACFIEGTTKSFKSFDQNWSTPLRCKVEGHYYSNVLGWLHPKGGQVNNMYNGLDLNNPESMKICVDIWKAVNDGKYIKKEDYDKKVEEFINEIKSKDTRIEEENKRYADLLVNLAEKLGCTNEEPAIFEQIAKLVGVEDQNRELQKTITKLQEELEEAKKNGQVVVKEACHSKLCAFLAKIGL